MQFDFMIAFNRVQCIHSLYVRTVCTNVLYILNTIFTDKILYFLKSTNILCPNQYIFNDKKFKYSLSPPFEFDKKVLCFVFQKFLNKKIWNQVWVSTNPHTFQQVNRVVSILQWVLDTWCCVYMRRKGVVYQHIWIKYSISTEIPARYFE